MINSNHNFNIDVWLNQNVFHNKINGVYLQCGANNGYTDSISYFYEKNFNWSGILIQPLPELMNICKLCRNKNNIFIQKGLSDKNTILQMTIPNDNLDNSSFNMSIEHMNQLKSFGMGKSYRTQKIEVISYINMINEVKINKIDLAIFDVEGHEQYILKNVIESNVLPTIMVVQFFWSDKNKLINIISNKYDIIKEYQYDFILKRKN